MAKSNFFSRLLSGPIEDFKIPKGSGSCLEVPLKGLAALAVLTWLAVLG